MPEGHTIHRLAVDLRDTLGGRPVQASSPQGRFTSGAALIDGEALTRSSAYGKYLFCQFGGTIVHIHLGLIGKLRPSPAGTAPRDSIRLRLENDDVVWHLTGPSRCDIVTPAEERAITIGLGADPLRPRPNVALLRERLRVNNKPIGAVLLDQKVIAGIGNVYRAEILFLCGIHPRRPASSISDDEFTDLWTETRRQLRRGVRLNRIVTTDPREIGKPLARIVGDDRLYVYHRSNCRGCGTELQTIEVGGRPISFCPVHQS